MVKKLKGIKWRTSKSGGVVGIKNKKIVVGGCHKISITDNNQSKLRKKYPIALEKLDEIAGKKPTSQNYWLKSNDYNKSCVLKRMNKSLKHFID